MEQQKYQEQSTLKLQAGLVPANLNLSKSALGITLGVWNLSEQPTIYFMTTAKLLSWGEYKPTIFHLGKCKEINYNEQIINMTI